MAKLIHLHVDVPIAAPALEALVVEGKAYRCAHAECYGTENHHLNPGVELADVMPPITGAPKC